MASARMFKPWTTHKAFTLAFAARNSCTQSKNSKNTVPCSLAKAQYFGAADRSIAVPSQKPFMIGIAGGTACGKTSVCTEIIEKLQADSTPHHGILSISQDCFYKDLSPSERSNIATHNFDHPAAFDFTLINDTLNSLRAGSAVNIPMYDFITSMRCNESTLVETADVILFDGILALYDTSVRDMFDLKIFVDTDADTRLVRRVRRDVSTRGRDVLQVLDQYERTVKPSFDSYILPTKAHADIIIPRGAENVVAIDLLLQHIRNHIRTMADSERASILATAA